MPDGGTGENRRCRRHGVLHRKAGLVRVGPLILMPLQDALLRTRAAHWQACLACRAFVRGARGYASAACMHGALAEPPHLCALRVACRAKRLRHEPRLLTFLLFPLTSRSPSIVSGAQPFCPLQHWSASTMQGSGRCSPAARAAWCCRSRSTRGRGQGRSAIKQEQCCFAKWGLPKPPHGGLLPHLQRRWVSPATGLKARAVIQGGHGLVAGFGDPEEHVRLFSCVCV